jgi:hypothetical protein
MSNQKKESPSLSPIYLENLFNQTLSNIPLVPDDQEKVNVISNFIRDTSSFSEDITYSFHLQISGLFFFLTSNFQPDPATPEELHFYLHTGLHLYHRFSDKIDKQLFREALVNLFFHLALNYFYLGELEEGWRALIKKKLVSEKNSLEDLESELEEINSLPVPEALEIKKNYFSNLEMVRAFFDRLKPKTDLISDQELILEKWKKFSGKSNDSTYCCLVERPGLLQVPFKAKLVLLESHCRQAVTSDVHNLFRFYNASPFQKDEVYHCAADALEAADYLIKNLFHQSLPPCALSFSFAEKKFVYSGESIGLPLALLALSQKLISNQTRFFFNYSKEVAFTGKIDLNGRVLRIDPDALELKIKGAFYSGLRYLVIPAANLKEASVFLYKLLSRHPSRRLDLVGVNTLEEIISDDRVSSKTIVPLITWIIKKKKITFKRALSALLIIAMIVMSVVLISKNPALHFWKIRHPIAIELHNGNLLALNQERQLLWRFALPRPFDPQSLIQKFIDLNGDKEEEILVAGNYKSDEKPSSELFCFGQSGKLLWEYRPGKRIKTLTDEFSNNFVIKTFEVTQLQNGSAEKSILVLSTHATWYPTQISLLNPKGKLLGEYWNAGHLGKDTLIIEDLDDDGWKEIVLGGTNNDFQAACLVVLDPRKIAGCSPASGTPEFQFKDLPAGTQEFYLLFPRTTLNQALAIRNYVRMVEISREDKNLEVTTTEYSKDIDYEMKYNFDFQLIPIFSRPVDILTEKVKELVISGTLPFHALTELRMLKEKIRSWDGQGWVFKPTRNKTLDF